MIQEESVLFAENISFADCKNGCHINPRMRKCVLIQIVDHGMVHPLPAHQEDFCGVVYFIFDDETEGPNVISDRDAEYIADIIRAAWSYHWNIVVHCVAGICRSGAVVEAAISYGFTEVEGRERIPNTLVKSKIMKYLGTRIDNSTSMFC